MVRVELPSSVLINYLGDAERHILRGETILAHQELIIAKMEADGCDTTRARELLQQFKLTHASHIADRDALSAELAGSRLLS